MTKRLLVVSAMVGTLTLYAGLPMAAEQDREQMQMQEQEQAQGQIFGSQLMTDQERLEYHERMRAAQSMEERDQIRQEHHERMLDRARKLGVTLPDEPPAMGQGMGPGTGMGSDMGRGGGMGSGGGMGRGGGGRGR